jgi:hypothetical protein
VWKAKGILVVFGFGLAAAGVSAGQSIVQFSARTVQSSPDKTSREARIHVGDSQVRIEYESNDQQLVEIYDMKHQRAVLLLPQEHSYMERSLPSSGVTNPMLPPDDTSPCAQMKAAQCKKLGQETLEGRPVDKWEMVVKHENQTLRSLHWVDAERNMSLRQIFPDGSISEMHLKGREKLHGRATERWELTTTGPDKVSMTTTQWYDPELKIAVREELPGGYYRELTDIRVERQPPELFAVPPGYTQAAPPQTSFGNSGPGQVPQRAQPAPQRERGGPAQPDPYRQRYPVGSYPGR